MQIVKSNGWKLSHLLFIVAIIALLAGNQSAQTPAPATSVRPTELTATSIGVSGAGEKIDFVINTWSTNTERDQLSAAWSVPPAGAAPAPAAAGGRGGGNGGGGRGGRGGGGGAAAPKTPEAALAGAMKEFPDRGYFWTSEVGGYLIRYAYKTSLPNGGTRILLLTDKRLGTAKNKWQIPAPATPNNYEFTLIELRLPPKGDGEGKVSLTGSLTVDPDTRSVALSGYDGLPVLMNGVKLR